MENYNEKKSNDFYFLVRSYVENNRKEEELFAVLALELSEEKYFEILDAISDILRFLKVGVHYLKYYSATEEFPVQEHHIKYFIDVLKAKLPHEDETTCIFPDYRIAMTIEKMKRSINILKILLHYII